jgi:hypothetical protein
MMKCDRCGRRAVANLQRVWTVSMINEDDGYGDPHAQFDVEEPTGDDNLHLCRRHAEGLGARLGARRATRRADRRPCRDLRQQVDRLSVERLLSETTILRVTLDFLQEKGLADEYLKYLRRRSR